MNAVAGSTHSNSLALAAKQKVASQFFKKGIVIALFSGLMYGFYSAFLTLGMSKGVWADWYGAETVLSAFVITYLLGALGSAVNDTTSAGWALLNVGVKGKMGDFFRTLKTKPGRVMILAALVGGPISSTAYVVGLQMAGSIVIPITALCPAIGAILGRLLYKQQLNKRMMLGIAICVIASFMIGSTSIGGDAPKGMLLGILIAFIAALGWGFEGCVAGYGTSMIDYEISITIRQVISGLSNLIILIPIFGLLAGDIGLSADLAIQAFSSGPAMIWIAIGGFCAWISYMCWYRGNSMCGAALGMACNGTYSFWGPFCCWIVLGVIFGMDGWSIPPIAWIAAVVMVFGILLIAMNPLDLFKKGNRHNDQKIAS
ncbi:EamA family transporter [Neobacillus sp. DY30]|uniref:EamA family transporter n=1 Tax=Neobacillus sp. DY30 TaxID=3047871 RepID=UPI0024BFBD1F|nr:EamA family transporter [Neobacillus sp. DY30]WHY02503.1 EamA family transporter [Neobacillus sp. DY30]